MALATARIEWVKPPAWLSMKLAALGTAVEHELDKLGRTVARMGQAYAIANAPWTNRTGFARASLEGTSESSGGGVTITIAHGAEYGIWLEVSNGRRYGIIPATVAYMQSQAAAGLDGLLARAA